MEKVNVKWNDDMAFTADIDGFEIQLDAAPENGGHNSAPRPKPLLLVALAGCTGMDVVSLAKKMRVKIDEFNVEVESEKSTEIPIVYTSMRLLYKFRANEDDKEKIVKIVTMSQERYCGVSAMLSKAAKIGYRIELNGVDILSRA